MSVVTVMGSTRVGRHATARTEHVGKSEAVRASRLRPYLLATALFAAASTVMYVDDAALLRYGLPWAMASLLIVVAVANLWGVRPALLVLSLSVLHGVAVVPFVVPPTSPSGAPVWQALLLRTTLFIGCGIATVWLTYRARLMQGRVERKREVVTALRSMILPNTLADAPGYDVCSVYRPAHRDEEVGGDFYDFYPLGNGIYGIFIGDVMGHGKEAAASTALLRYSVRAFTSIQTSPAAVLDQLDRLIEMQEQAFTTASLFLGVLDTRSGRLCYANAGHESPMLMRASGEEATLQTTGPILGTRLGIAYKEQTVTLGKQDTLFLTTDGVTEARNPHGVFLDKEGTWQLLRTALQSETAQEALARFDTALTSYSESSQSDDIAMLLLRAAPATN